MRTHRQPALALALAFAFAGGCGAPPDGDGNDPVGALEQAVATPTTLAAGAPRGVTSVGSNVFFTRSVGEFCSPAGLVKRVAVAGGAATTLLSDCAEDPGEVVSDGSSAFYIDRAGDRLRKVTSTGIASTLAPGPGLAGHGALAADSSYVYFADDAGIHRVPKGGGADLLLSAVPSVRGLAADPWHVYFTSDLAADRHVGRLPKAGGAVLRIADGGDLLRGVQVDSVNVYWRDGSYLLGAPKAGGAVTRYVTVAPGAVFGGFAARELGGARALFIGVYASTVRTSGAMYRVDPVTRRVAAVASGLTFGIRSLAPCGGYICYGDVDGVKRLFL